ncbi:MAG: hypothetical protein ACKV0T_06820 [Planctomycetales bacterium]
MSDAQKNAILNDLLIQVHRSLLQYTEECWPWTDLDQAAEHRAIQELAHQQRELVGRLARLLDQRQQTVDFGTYPDWSGLHYVSLDFLLARLIDDERQLIAAIERGRSAFENDPPAATLAVELLASQRNTLKRLEELAAARKATVAA